MELQPMRLGFYADSLIAKFGGYFEFKTGYNKDNYMNKFNAYLNQLVPEQRIKSMNLKVMDYLMPNKQGFQSYMGKYILTFFAKNGQKLSVFENVSDDHIKEKIDEGFRLE